MQHCGFLMKLSLRLSFTAGWRYWAVRNRECEREGGAAQQHSSTPPLSYFSIAPREALHPPGYLATWHLAQLRCQATRAWTIIQAPEQPIPLLSSLLPVSLSFHSSHLRSLPSFSSTQYFIWQLTLYQPLYWSMDCQHILTFCLLSFCLHHSL